jgi:hypothetical protein
MSIDVPQRRLNDLHELAAHLLERRKAGTDLEHLSRDLLRGFYDLCVTTGLDRVLGELEATERTSLEERESLSAALVAQLGSIDLDGGGPRNAKPKQVAECVVAALGLNLVEEPDAGTSLGGDVRAAVVAAISRVVEAELAVPKIREDVISEARARCPESAHGAFNKVVAQLDDRGAPIIKQPKVPIDAMQAVTHALTEARAAIIARVCGTAIDRAKEVIAKADADAAARIDLPISLAATPREVATRRTSETRVGLTPSKVVHALVEGLSDLARITWRAPEQVVHAYAASKTFKIGDLIEHPKFGRGAVVGSLMQRIDVEFPDGKHTLIHVPPRR